MNQSKSLFPHLQFIILQHKTFMNVRSSTSIIKDSVYQDVFIANWSCFSAVNGPTSFVNIWLILGGNLRKTMSSGKSHDEDLYVTLSSWSQKYQWHLEIFIQRTKKKTQKVKAAVLESLTVWIGLTKKLIISLLFN